MGREILEILEQFGGGGPGDPGNNAVRFLLAGFFWAGLALVAFRQFRRQNNRRDLYIAVAASIGFAREALMFALEYGAWRHWVPPLLSYRVFPPLEHALTDLGRVVLGFAYLRYYPLTRPVSHAFLRIGSAVFLGLYLVTAPLWVGFLDRHAELYRGVGVHFGLFWGDLAFRVAASVAMAFVLWRLFGVRRKERPIPGPLLAGFAFLFLDEFLMVCTIFLGDEEYRTVFGPLRHNLGIWAIPLFLSAYWAEVTRKLRNEKARSEGILQAIGDAIGIEDPRHILRYQNPAHRALFGGHVGEDCAAIHPQAPTDCPLAATIATGERSVAGSSLVTAEGVRHLEVSSSPLHDEEGRISGAIALTRDVTDRRRMVEALIEGEERYRTLVQNIGHGITLIDTNYTVLMANPTHARLVRKEGRAIVGQPCFLGIHGRDAVCPDCPGTTAMATGRKASVEKETVRVDGSALSVRIQAFPVRGADGAISGFIELVEDITAEKRLQAEQQRLEARIRQAQKMESLGILAGGIAHDFNNLLMGILGNADLALAKATPESPVRPYLQRIDTAAQRAADLTNQMLAYSGKGRFVVEELNLSRLVEEMGHLLATVTSKRATVRYRLAPDLPPVAADATQVRQIVMNLITNASDALGEREGLITVATGAVHADEADLATAFLSEPLPAGDYVFVEVSDNGTGMDAQTQTRIFDPFFTTKQTGRGLGLAAALGIIRGHRGGIKVYSEPGRGSTIKVFLPAVAGPGEGLGRQPAVPAGSAARRGCGRILLVDDEAAVRDTAAAMLEECGYAVITAADGEEAVRIFRERRDGICAVILDVVMPRMGGKEAFRQMQRIDPRVPVILSSGFSEDEASDGIADKGLAGFIQKPYRMQALAEKLLEATARGGKSEPGEGDSTR